MIRIAEAACHDLAIQIMGGLTYAWKRADKIERRWRIQGCTLAYVERFEREHNAFLDEQSKRHDALNPDRLTYLHR